MLKKITLPEFVSRKNKFILLSLVPLYFLIFGLFIQPLDEIIIGLQNIIIEPDLLITDYIVIGGIGASFINASVLTLVTLFLIYKFDLEFDGHTLTATFLMLGFSLFGKNIVNIWTILIGVWLYAIYHRMPVSKILYIGFYGTCLSPIITQVLSISTLPESLRFILSIIIGVLIGFILPPLSSHLYSTHRGFSLYNVGFAAGIISTVIASLFKSFGIETKSRLLWSTGNNQLFIVLLGIFFTCMIIFGLLHSRRGIINYLKILISSGVNAPDYLLQYGHRATAINMGVNGLIATFVVIIIGGELNGPTIGGIFTIVGFSSTGKHILNIVPIMIGVIVAGSIKDWNISDPAPLITLLFSTTLAPIAGRFGFFIGILAGFVHSSVALNIGILYDGMNLYNNGFAGGIVASFLVPIILSFKDRQDRIKKVI